MVPADGVLPTKESCYVEVDLLCCCTVSQFVVYAFFQSLKASYFRKMKMSFAKHIITLKIKSLTSTRKPKSNPPPIYPKIRPLAPLSRNGSRYSPVMYMYTCIMHVYNSHQTLWSLAKLGISPCFEIRSDDADGFCAWVPTRSSSPR